MTGESPRKSKISAQAIRHGNIFWPGRDDGIQRLDDRPLAPEILDHGVDIEAFFALSSQSHRQHATNIIKRYKRFRAFDAGVAFPNTLAVATDVRISKTITTIGNKYFFSGASGGRMLVKMTRTDTPSKQKRLEKIIQSFEKRRAKNELAIPIVDGDVRNLNLVIMAKNLFNFYHFTLETLPSLALYREYNLTGLIIIHTATKRQGDFVKDQVLSLFPELASRVALQYADIRLSKALVVLDSKFLYFQTHDDQMPSIGDLCRKSWLWRDRDLDRQSHKTLTMNSYAQPLRMLRDRVVARVQETADDQAAPSKPRRLYVRRKQAGRLRGIVNEDLLIEMLDGLGFATVYFEDHNVLEQARLMSQAEIVVSVHGAGMTNMLYVPEGCLVVELSSLQIIMLRFGDFNPLALASRAKYLHFVVDHDWPDQETIPDFKTNSIVGLKVDELAVQQLRARLLQHVEEVEFETLMEEGRSLNDASGLDALGELLDDYAGRLLHKADMHVWAANCAASGGDFHGALDHLLRAVRLAPMRQSLLERGLLLAHRLGQKIAFNAITFDYFCHSESAARSFFAENGWGLPDGIEPDVPSVAEK